jgi:hypothetical protein
MSWAVFKRLKMLGRGAKKKVKEVNGRKNSPPHTRRGRSIKLTKSVLSERGW